MPTRALLACLITIAAVPFASSAQGESSDPDAKLSAIKRQLGPRTSQARKDVTWYVVLLRERTQTKITVTYIKVQGQDAAATAIHDFLQQPASAYRDFAGRHFPNTDKGRRDAANFHESEILAGIKSVLLATLLR